VEYAVESTLSGLSVRFAVVAAATGGAETAGFGAADGCVVTPETETETETDAPAMTPPTLVETLPFDPPSSPPFFDLFFPDASLSSICLHIVFGFDLKLTKCKIKRNRKSNFGAFCEKQSESIFHSARQKSEIEFSRIYFSLQTRSF
jgi:hypothetical protein